MAIQRSVDEPPREVPQWEPLSLSGENQASVGFPLVATRLANCPHASFEQFFPSTQ
jgi:hypothetical protein